MNVFDYVNSINYSKEDIMITEDDEKVYDPFLTNRQLSYFQDTVLLANEMNKYHHLDKRLQFHFLLNIVRKRKRFSKWFKPETIDDLEAVKEYYGYSSSKTKTALTLLSSEEITTIKKRIHKGGRK